MESASLMEDMKTVMMYLNSEKQKSMGEFFGIPPELRKNYMNVTFLIAM